MLTTRKYGVIALALFISALLTGCGGGGGGSSSTPGTTSSLTVSGTAATGMAIAGATISAKCQVGTGTTTTIADGTYSLVVAGGNLPCVLQITNPLDGSKLHTVATGSGSTAFANITPLTEMLTARVLSNDPAVFFAAFDAAVAASTVTTAAVMAAQTDVGAILSGTVDTSSLGDFIATPLKAATPDNVAGGDAQDKILDALRAKLNGAQLTQVVTTLAHTPNTADIKQVVATIAAVPPTAHAGVVQNVLAGTAVTLDGSASTADVGRTLTYAWTLTAKPVGSLATLASPTSAKPTFTADVAGAYVASLIVNDGTVNSAPVTVSITSSTANAAPVANAGTAQNVTTGTLVTLNGSNSSDANGDTLTYAWSLTAKPAGSTATLTGATSALPTFTADLAGTYVASLTVNDGKVNSTATTVTVTAAVANVAPVANAGVAQNVVAGSVVTLDGSASTDANGDPLTYVWSLTAKPAGSSATLASFTSAKPTFIADVAGTYVASLIVNDGKVNSSVATSVVTAADRCASSLGNEANFSYDWSLATQKVTIKNNNNCDSIYVRATSAPIYTNSVNGVVDVRFNLAPGATLVADAVLPASLTWKPSIIYSLPNGKTYVYRPIQAGQSIEYSFELLLLDNADSYDGTLSQFSAMFSIGQTEDHYGDCANFSWIDRRNGKFRISPNTSGVSGECYVGNIQGVATDGSGIYLPALRYFVTTR